MGRIAQAGRGRIVRGALLQSEHASAPPPHPPVICRRLAISGSRAIGA
jgi:hypothetical protein